MQKEYFKFEEFFDLSEIQRIQDQFTLATGVAAIMCDLDGIPITRPSNFNNFCYEIVRKTEKGIKNCMLSDSVMSKPCLQGPFIHKCLSAGLMDGGVSIIVDGDHIANWLVGQVMNNEIDISELLPYADEIGVDRESYMSALDKVPRMSKQQFQNICDFLFVTAQQVSKLAAKNVMLSTEIQKRETVEHQIRELNVELEKKIQERTYQLKEVNDELHKLNEELEVIVAQRTKQLEMMNQELKAANSVLKREISERIQIEEKLKKSKWEAERANRAKSQFLANMSHEIRTPMNGIIGMTELALMTVSEDERIEYLGIVKSSARSLLRVLNDILDYSKIESDKVELERQPFDIYKIINEVVDLFSVSAGQKNLKISCEIDNNIPERIIGDSIRLRQILSNIVGNAVKFTAQGEVAIRVGCQKLDDSKIRLHFEVIDTGIGISEENMYKLFQRFSQVDDSYTKRFGGSGLGLAISKKLIEMMGGEIGAESKEHVGSRFYFAIVFEYEDQMHQFNSYRTEDGFLPSQDIAQKRILLVEDDKVSQKVASDFLQKKGLRVTFVEDGIDAVEQYLTDEFDLILMDINLPNMDGFSATEAIRQSEKASGRHIPIIAMTAYALTGDREKCLKVGMDDYISKPIDFSLLDKKIHEWLNKAQ
ncbi:MAG TPA: PocR ligand-binding domain-containing protein [Clostridia bacterium]|nr:PocR ligand-binding domain-containing protein [Clostridia bacterium]